MTNQLSKLKKRLLQSTKAKCVDGNWSADGLPLPDALLVVGFTRGLQCWKDGELLDELDERDGELPDVDELNSQIPQEEWATGLNGQPEPPWRIVYVVYLVDPETAELFTWINSGYFAMLAYEELTERIKRMTRLRGSGVTEIVKPDRRPQRIKKLNITKQRPHFAHIEWRDLGEREKQPAQLPPPTDKDPAGAAAPIEKEKKETDDKSPPREDSPSNRPATAAAAKAPAEKKKKVTVGKPVQPPTAAEELNDEIPREFL